MLKLHMLRDVVGTCKLCLHEDRGHTDECPGKLLERARIVATLAYQERDHMVRAERQIIGPNMHAVAEQIAQLPEPWRIETVAYQLGANDPHLADVLTGELAAMRKLAKAEAKRQEDALRIVTYRQLESRGLLSAETMRMLADEVQADLRKALVIPE